MTPTNSILKSKYDNVIDDITNEFTPEMMVVCEIPPILNNVKAISKVEMYNDYYFFFNCMSILEQSATM